MYSPASHAHHHCEVHQQILHRHLDAAFHQKRQEDLRDLLRRFIRRDVVDSANTVTKLLGIDLDSRELHVQATVVDVGFAA